jgi:hypothetical protein
VHELAYVDIGTDLVVGLQAGDLGVDEVRAELVRQRDRPRRGRKLRSKSALRSSEPMICATGISRTPR